MVVTDARQPDHPIILANQAFLQLTGYAADEVIGRNCRFLQGVGTSASVVAQIRHALDEVREITTEILNYRKDGSAFWNQLHFSPIFDDHGTLSYYFASQIDVTDFRRVQSLEASEHRLLMEVDHRAKNVLAIVDSIVRLSRSDNSAQYASSVQQRVQALSVAHLQLAETGWRDVSLRDVIVRQVERYKTKNVVISGPEVRVPAEGVQPLALLFHELASNAAVHGALFKPDGLLSVSWARTDDQVGFRLSWSERVSLSKTRGKPGFGTIMADAIVEKQLLGTLDRRWDDEGLEIIIEIPASTSPTSSIDRSKL